MSQPIERHDCPWCWEPYDVDPALAAWDYVCPHCKQPASLAALRFPNRRSSAFDEGAATSLAAMENLYRHTVAYTFQRYNQQETASGTLIEIEGRVFVATVEHAMPAKAAQKVEFVIKVERGASHQVKPQSVSIIRTGRHPSLDVGFFEVTTNTPAELNMEAVTLDRVADLITGNSDLKTWIMGYPGEYLVPGYKHPEVLGFRALGYGTGPIDPAAWPAIANIVKAADANTDVLLTYERDDVIRHKELRDGGSRSPEPWGMSGGGIWQAPTITGAGQLWHAERISLFAIQSSWPNKNRFLKAVQIIHWLHPLKCECPELGSMLVSRYPRLNTLTD